MGHKYKQKNCKNMHFMEYKILWNNNSNYRTVYHMQQQQQKTKTQDQYDNVSIKALSPPFVVTGCESGYRNTDLLWQLQDQTMV